MDDSKTDGGPLRITWFGHSTVLVELDGARLLTDPFLRGRIGHVRRVADRVELDAAKELDAVLISHAHHDHLDLRTLRRLGRSVRMVVPTGTRRMLARRGYSNVTELGAGDETSVGSVAIAATHAEHPVRRYPFGEDAVALGYVISGSARVYFAGDTDLFDDMREIGTNVDVALIPVAGWGPRLPPGHLNPESAATAVRLLHPKIAVPIHWGTYRRFGLERDESLLRAPAETFAELAHQLAPDVEIRLLPVGGTFELRRPDRSRRDLRKRERWGSALVSAVAATRYEPLRPRIKFVRLLVSWILSALALAVAARVIPGVTVDGWESAFKAAAIIAVLNAVLPPVLAALRLPFTLLLGFVLVLVLDALMFMLAARIAPDSIDVDSFGSALAAAFVASAVAAILDPIFRSDDDETYMLRVTRRIARRTGGQIATDVPGIIFLEIDGLALPILRRAMRDGSAPEMARWIADEDYELSEWETDLSSQTGASQAGILLGSNEDIPAFRWIEKESGRTMTCSKPDDCEEIERRLSIGNGLLRAGGASRGNLLSGEAEQVILTVSRINEEKRANPGYRVFFANGFNVMRMLVLLFWEVFLEWSAALRARRRDVRPRGHRGGAYPFMRAAMCVVVRDLIVYGVISDMMKGRPAVYATFSSYDEVAHHSGLERADTLEALRKLDQQFGRIARARHYAPRPYEIVVLSDHGQTQGATFLQRNSYDLAELVTRSLANGTAGKLEVGDENDAMVGHAVQEATGGAADGSGPHAAPERAAAVLASGNLGLVYLLEEPRRLTLEEIDERHPKLIPALRSHPHIGVLLVRSAKHGPLAIGANGIRYLAGDRVEGEDPLAHFSPNAAQHLRRTDSFPHVPDIMVNSFYDPQLDEGCAFEELISFHGGLGGPQTRPFILHPPSLRVPDEPLVGAASVHKLLTGWRTELQNSEVAAAPETEAAGAGR